MGIVGARRLNGPYRRRAHRDDDVHLFLDQLGRQARKPGGIAVGDARHQLDLLSLAAGATQSCENNLDTGRRDRQRSGIEEPDPGGPLRSLRLRRERPTCHRAPEQRDELAPPHSITSSACASSVAGTSRPSALAVCRLNTNSNLAARITGRLAGVSTLENSAGIDAGLAISVARA